MELLGASVFCHTHVDSCCATSSCSTLALLFFPTILPPPPGFRLAFSCTSILQILATHISASGIVPPTPLTLLVCRMNGWQVAQDYNAWSRGAWIRRPRKRARTSTLGQIRCNRASTGCWDATANGSPPPPYHRVRQGYSGRQREFSSYDSEHTPTPIVVSSHGPHFQFFGLSISLYMGVYGSELSGYNCATCRCGTRRHWAR